MENKTNNIFRVGDKVYDCFFGWGVVDLIYDHGPYPIRVNFKKARHCETYTYDGLFDSEINVKRLSFTKYDFVNGGFSQIRPN